MVLHFIAAVIIIYLGCSIIGLIRQKLFEKPMVMIASKTASVTNKLEKYLDHIFAIDKIKQ